MSALPLPSIQANVSAPQKLRAVAADLPPTSILLTANGDARIHPNAMGVNVYGCATKPAPHVISLGSSTASCISPGAYHSAYLLRTRLASAYAAGRLSAACTNGFERMRDELLALCEIGFGQGVDVLFAASGTDLHLIVPQLLQNAERTPLHIVAIDPAETGSGVPYALAGKHFGDCAASGASATPGMPLYESGNITVASVALRMPDGRLRPTAEVDAEFADSVECAVARGQRVLLTMVDHSKTGCIAPSLGSVLDLKRKIACKPGAEFDVLVDACQFRISAATLRAYLEQDFIVAVTGSKFLTGPSFSGALLIPEKCARSLRKSALPVALHAYCGRGEWPASWPNAASLPDRPNPGLLLRWEAALHELRAFRQIPDDDIARFLQEFATVVRRKLVADPAFEVLAQAPLDRSALNVPGGWDSMPTVFSFLVTMAKPGGVRRPLDGERTRILFRQLQQDMSFLWPVERDPSARDIQNAAILGLACQFGQPVACGNQNHGALSALRVCASARMIVEALTGDASSILRQTEMALDKLSMLAQRLSSDTEAKRI